MNSFFKLPALTAIFYMLASLLEHLRFLYYVIGKHDPAYKEMSFLFDGVLKTANSFFFYSLCLCFVTIFVFYCHRIYLCSLKNICLLLLITIVVKLLEYVTFSTASMRLDFIGFFFILIALWYGLFILLRRFFDTTQEDFPFDAKQTKRIHCHFYCFLYATLTVAMSYFYMLPSNRELQYSVDKIEGILFNSVILIQFFICYILLFNITKSLFSEKFSSLQLKRLFKSVGWSACFCYLAQMGAALIFVLTSSLFFIKKHTPEVSKAIVFPALILIIALIFIFIKINRVAVKRYFGDNANTLEDEK